MRCDLSFQRHRSFSLKILFVIFKVLRPAAMEPINIMVVGDGECKSSLIEPLRDKEKCKTGAGRPFFE